MHLRPMLKHPQITVRRIEQWIETELEKKLILDREPLKIEFCPEPHETQTAAKKGPWQVVEPGFGFGPAYRTVWFRVTGKIPARMKGMALGVMPELGGERTLWKDNCPAIGIDVEHHVIPMWERAEGVIRHEDGPIELYIQSYTRNPQVSVHREGPPREAEVEFVKFAHLVGLDLPRKDLYFDCKFALNLLQSWEDNSPEYHLLLRALNRICNLSATQAENWIAQSRKILKDLYSSLNHESHHTIYPVGHAHLDTAWLWPIHITQKKMAHTAATQLHFMEEYPEYVYVHSQASQYEWVEKQYPKLFDRIQKAIDRGQWEPVGSMWVEADCNLTGAESMVRQFLYGKKYFREVLGVETEDMFLPDVFGYSAALPQILNKFNIKFFLTQKISWNQVNKFPHNTFLWQGIDGSRIWSHFPPADTYIGNCTPKEISESVKKHKDHGRSNQSLYLFGFGDGGGGPTEQHLEFIKRAALAPSMPEVNFGKKAIDFYREAKAKSRDLPVWTGELYLEIHRGTYTSQAANKKANRDCEFLLRDAEWLACFTPGIAYPADPLEKAWKLVLLNQFHDIIPGSSVREVYEESDRDYAAVKEIGTKVVHDSLVAIGKNLETEQMQRPVVLFHNASMSSQGEIPWEPAEVPGSLACPEETLPVQLVEEFGERKLVFASPYAALGSVCVADLTDQPSHSRPRLKVSNRRLENHEFSVRFDGNGHITSIQSLEDGSEFIRPGSPANVFQFMDDQPLFWSAWDIDIYAYETVQELTKLDSFEIVERGPVRVAVELVRKFSKSQIRQRISLGPTPGIRFDTEIDWHEEDKLLKVAFPLNINALRASYEIQFGHVERPTHMNTSWDMARFEVPAQKWVDVSEADQGVALINNGKYGHDCQGNVLRLTLLKAPKAPDPLCDMGTHRFSYVLYPHFGPLNHAGVVQAAYAINAPCRHAFLDRSPGVATALAPFIACEDRNIVIEAVKRSEYDKGVIVRLYECHNARGLAELFSAHPPKQCFLCDLEENVLEELEVVEGMVPFKYKPFEIITLKLVF